MVKEITKSVLFRLSIRSPLLVEHLMNFFRRNLGSKIDVQKCLPETETNDFLDGDLHIV